MPILHWLTREADLRKAREAPYRLLTPVPELGYGDPGSENLLIQGDNLEGLKSLLPYYAGRVKCIYIDPPYNTRTAFEHYDDNLEHTQWLAMIYPRLELLREFLSEDGSIWVSIDDNEGHYLKVVMDEIFGRDNFIATIVWQKRYSRENRESIGDVHEYIHVYVRKPDNFKASRNLVPLTEQQAKVYRNPNNDPRGRWRPVPITAQEGHATPEQFFEITTPSGKVHRPPSGRCWGIAKATYDRLLAEGRIYFGKSGSAQPNIIRYLSEVPGMTPWTWWPSDEVGHTDESKKEIHSLFGKVDAFDSPKPERLLQRIIHVATNPGDLVLDSFLGSGTAAAVAHKMGRRWIGIEMGEHAVTHCAPRLRKVIDGEQGGISEAVGWHGGGGFCFHRLGETIFDETGRINPAIRFPVLAAHVWFCETGSPYLSLSSRAAERMDGVAPDGMLPESMRGDAGGGPPRGAQPVGASTSREWSAAGPRPLPAAGPLLGAHGGTAIYLLYNGILGDKRPDSGNVLTSRVLADLPPHDGPKVVYGEATRLSPQRLREAGITFRQIPYDLKAR
jgi:adenine-specific DNA-methyltransferase